MVELVILQSISYMAGALGVCIAAVYYIFNMRAAERNRKIQLNTNIAEKLSTKEWQADFMQLMNYSWSDVDDFMNKYDSSVNPESHDLRWMVWQTYDNIGYLLREGLVDPRLLFNSQGVWSIMLWGHFKPIMDHYRKTEMGPRWMENFEYMAGEMWKIAKVHGTVSPDFKDNLVCDIYKDVYESKIEKTARSAVNDWSFDKRRQIMPK